MSIVTCRSHRSRNLPKRFEVRSPETRFSYVGGTTGAWRVTNVSTLCGTPLKPATHVQINQGELERIPQGASWVLSGVVSNSRYVAREDLSPFSTNGTNSHRAETTCAALFMIRKSAAWWNLEREDQFQILKSHSGHLASALRFLPAIARRLRQGRDVGENFDFVTWFEYAPQDAETFDAMVAAFRSLEEWRFVEREIDIRLERDID